ncbi:putative increased rDNA silencing protein [Rosellinia necatrix]|uniref:Putative increased rDNA silencing protein n=1 Tax=Rosellinia necatrix TaxID=77044 RepID=A0A1W2TLM0_ROSNE|nr:putative increased rDNA silencing protein [Rosellinia necatrix]
MNNAGTPNQASRNDTTYNTALRGASLAFQKTAQATKSPSSPVPTPTRDPSNSRDNSALLAATSASRDHSLTRSLPLSCQTTGANSGSGPDHGLAGHFSVPRHAHPAARQNALISLFEKQKDATNPIKKHPVAPVVKKSHRPGLCPMTPPRAVDPLTTSNTLTLRSASTFAWEEGVLSSPSAGREIVDTKTSARVAAGTEPPLPTPHSHPTRKPRSITPPPKMISRANTVLLSPRPRQASSHKIVADLSDTNPSFGIVPPVKSTKQGRSHISKTMPSAASLIGNGDPSAFARRSFGALSHDTLVSASLGPSRQPDSPRHRSPQHPVPEAPQLSTAPPRAPVLKSPSHLPLDSLTTAIVAGSLAAARATPGTTKPPTPPPRKRTPHMRQTLRMPRSKSEEKMTAASSQHKKKPLGKLSSRKKHAHHEGARKRWREEITARERQRYEGVWASNRGLLLDHPSSVANDLRDLHTSQLVVNVVVRDIWARSRLPFDELAEVWALVDSQGKGALDKSQFVVGMWLIDQRLRGRKIPRKVSDSVWESTKGVRVHG